MKILTVTNFYPPYYVGGYELGCQDVMRGLANRGHEVQVLTSRHGLSPDAPVHTETNPHIVRALPDPYDDRRSTKHGLAYWAALVGWERASLAAWRRVLRDFQPDVIYCWNLSGLSYSLLLLATPSACPTAFYLSDEWLLEWPRRDPINVWLGTRPGSIPKRALKPLLDLAFRAPGPRKAPRSFDLRHAQFTSDSLRQAHLRAGLAAGSAQVIHWGVDAARFPPRALSEAPARRLLYVGNLAPHKGVHTVIEAFRLLHQSGRYPGLQLTLAGGSTWPAYHAGLLAAVQAADLAGHVHFLGLVSRDELPPVYQAHDILVFPSVWEEPFSITLLEALTSGLAVVGTTTGGTGEILVAEQNALTFPAGDAGACRHQLGRLLDDPALVARLARAGHDTVEARFQFSTMLDKIEKALLGAIDR